MKRIILVAGLATSLVAAPAARAEDAYKTTEAVGQGAIADGDLLAAKAAAKDDALRNCVQQVATTLVTASTETDQAQLLSDKVFAHSAGYIRNYAVVEDRQDGSSWLTKLRCEVSEAKLDEDMLAFGIAYRRAGMPRVMTLIAEQAINATQASGWWQGGGNASDLRVMENAFMDRMEKSGFTFIDQEVLSGKVTLEAIGADPNVQKAREIGRLAGAEVVIIGRSIAKPFGEVAIDGGVGGALYTAQANVSARAVRTDTGEVIASAEFSGPVGRAFERTAAGREALSAAGRQLARDLFTKIGKVWAREQSGSRVVGMVIKGAKDFGKLATFKNVLGTLKGVKDVQQRSFGGGQAELAVSLAGTTEELATTLATRRFKEFVVTVTGVSPGTLELELK